MIEPHWDLILEAAKKHNVDPKLVAAIVRKESGGQPWAMRYEPRWSYLFKTAEFAHRLYITEITEIHLQSFSYGLMQVMGSVCRELGFLGYLPQVLNPEIGLDLGCKKLRDLFYKYQDEKDVISAYNQGSPLKRGGIYLNQQYVDGVLKFKAEL